MLSKKRHRVGSSSRLSSTTSSSDVIPSIPNSFNDPSSSDVTLRLTLPDHDDVTLHLHSSSLLRSRYFSALLSDRWSHHPANLTLQIPPATSPNPNPNPFQPHIAVLQLLYSPSSSFASSAFTSSVSDALDLLPPALHLLFDELVSFLLSLLDSLPWSPPQESLIIHQILPLLSPQESQPLLARITPPSPSSSLSMLHSLIDSAIHSHPKVATVKLFVSKLLREYTDRHLVQTVLDQAFLSSLNTVKELLGKYASPDFRMAGDNDETEAMQRLNLHAAVVNARHLLWLVERMIELRVADVAAREWSEQGALAADLQKTFRDDAWRNIAPGLPSLVMRCTGRLAGAVAAGSIIAPKEVRMKLVKDWLPVLNVCRDIVSPMPTGHKMLYQELEETFLKIISTLPMSEAQELLQQCLCFSTRDIDDCPHLVEAFNTWFKRANRPPVNDDSTTD